MCFCTFEKSHVSGPPPKVPHIPAKMASRLSSLIENLHFTTCLSTFRGGPLYGPPPKLRTKTPPTRFRLLQNLQNLHFTMCLSTSRTCTPLKHRTKTPPRPQNDRFWCFRNRLYRGGPHARPKKGLSMMTF